MTIPITTELIKNLRDETSVSVMQCKKALEEAGGDREKALVILKKKSSDIAAKKADRVATDGTIVIKKANGKGVILALNCETDFVAKNSDFITLAEKLADKALADGVELLKANAPTMINDVIQKIGENIQLGEIVELSAPILGSYVHNGKTGVLVALSGDLDMETGENLGKDIAMHIVAMKPEYKTKDDIPADKRATAESIFNEEVNASGKPEDIKKKILEGKLNTYFAEQTLYDQPFVKNPDISIAKLLAQNGNVNVVSFMRLSIK